MSLRVGTDLVSVDQVRESISDHGQRYLHRVYTEHELSDSRLAPERLAARFAAKEATMKALGRRDEALSWRGIGVRRDIDGQPSIELSGGAAQLAQERGLERIAVSLSHEGDYATATVILECNP